ncbi:MAG: hypothetical protein R3E76_07775 [Planctomycetota bacterium]
MEPEAATVHPLRRAFLWGALFGTLIILFVGAALPILTSGHRDAPLSEGHQLSGSARDVARVAYSKSDTFSSVLDSGNQESPFLENFKGSYYATVNVVSYVGPDENAIYTITATEDRPTLRVQYHLRTGESLTEGLGPFSGMQP